MFDYDAVAPATRPLVKVTGSRGHGVTGHGVTRSRGHGVTGSRGHGVMGSRVNRGAPLTGWVKFYLAGRPAAGHAGGKAHSRGGGPCPSETRSGVGGVSMGVGSWSVVIKKTGAGCRFWWRFFWLGGLLLFVPSSRLSGRVVGAVVLWAGWRVRPGFGGGRSFWLGPRPE